MRLVRHSGIAHSCRDRTRRQGEMRPLPIRVGSFDSAVQPQHGWSQDARKGRWKPALTGDVPTIARAFPAGPAWAPMIDALAHHGASVSVTPDQLGGTVSVTIDAGRKRYERSRKSHRPHP